MCCEQGMQPPGFHFSVSCPSLLPMFIKVEDQFPDTPCQPSLTATMLPMVVPITYHRDPCEAVRGAYQFACVQGGDGRGAVAALSAAITDASAFDALEVEVEAATALRERWERRAEAVAQLDSVVAEV